MSFSKVEFAEGGLTVIDDQADEEQLVKKAAPSFSQVARSNAPVVASGQAYVVAAGGGGDASKSRVAQFASPCRLWAAGKCTFGSRCHFRHEQLQGDLSAASDAGEGDQDCAICMDRVMAKGDRFGLLLGCPHAFCLKCIRDWRSVAQQQHASLASTDAVRSCPICRTFSPYVIPSVFFVSDAERKQQLQDEFLAATGSTRCKYWSGRPGSCSFGSSCFYKHVNPDGSLGVDTTRTYVDADGIHVVHAENKTSLADFIVLPPAASSSSSSSVPPRAAAAADEVPKWARGLGDDDVAHVRQFVDGGAAPVAAPASATEKRPLQLARGFVDLDLSKPARAAAAPAPGERNVDDWSDAEQARLEDALKRFPGSVSDKQRWQSIADHVGRSRKDCVMRFRYCASLAQQQQQETK